MSKTVFIAMLLGLSGLSGCHSAQPRALGAAFQGVAPTTVQAIAALKDASPVIVEGEMIEKCPVAGCWFVLKDKTGVVRVDTKSAGFVVSDVPLHTRLTVAGTLTAGSQPGIAATGMRY